MIQHPAHIAGLDDLEAYLRFLGINKTRGKIMQVIWGHPEAATATMQGRGRRFSWNPDQINLMVRYLTGFDTDLWLKQRARDEARARSEAVEARQAARIAAGFKPNGRPAWGRPARTVGEPASATGPRSLRTYAVRHPDGVEEEVPGPRIPGAYPIDWAGAQAATQEDLARTTADEGQATRRLTAYAMRAGTLVVCRWDRARMVHLKFAEQDIPVGALNTDAGKPWAVVVSDTATRWPDALWYVHVAPTRGEPTAPPPA